MRILLPAPLTPQDLLGELTDVPRTLGEGHGGPITTDLALALVRAGHEVIGVSLDPSIGAVTEARGPSLTYIGVPMRSTGRGRDAYRFERRGLRSVIDQLDADIINAHWTFEYAAACLSTTRPLVVTAHDWPPSVLRHQHSPYWFGRSTLAARVMAARPPMTTPAPTVRTLMQRWLRLDVRLTPNGVPGSLLVEPRPAQPPGPPIVLTVANGFSPRKNTDLVLTAWPAIRDAVPDARLHLVGAGHGPGEAAQRWALAHGSTDGVAFLGSLSRAEVLAEMDRATVLAHPARVEPFGMVVIEAMARGVPVVAVYGSGGPEHILDDGAIGDLVGDRDAVRMASAVTALCRDEELWVRRVAAGLDRVRTTFRIEAVADSYVNAYEDLLSGRWEG